MKLFKVTYAASDGYREYFVVQAKTGDEACEVIRKRRGFSFYSYEEIILTLENPYFSITVKDR